MSTANPKAPATLDDLHRVEGRAELIAGRIVHLTPAGHRSSRVEGEILMGIHDYARSVGRGEAFTGGLAFAVPKLPSGRESFSPNVSYYDGPLPADDMDFIQGPPTFAVEVRCQGDYGGAAESDMAAKRADYFLAGTRVVWDVDPIAECVRVYRADAIDRPVTYHKGQWVDAEPAVPGWRMVVDDIFI